MKHVIIIDSHKIFREGVKAILNSKTDLDIVGESEDATEMLDLCGKESVDIVIVDPKRVKPDGITIIDEIHKNNPAVKILVLTEADYNDLQNIINADVAGYVLKDSGEKELLKAIDTIRKGENYYSNEITRRVVSDYVKKRNEKVYKGDPGVLTEREREVLLYICREYTNQEIAEKLSISVRTVDSHRRNLLQKTGARNTAGLVSFAIKHKLYQLQNSRYLTGGKK